MKLFFQSAMTVKWALETITMIKVSGGDGIPVELFQILKDEAVKVVHQYASKSGKLSSGHKTGKGQFSFQSQRKYKETTDFLITHEDANYKKEHLNFKAILFLPREVKN